MENWGLVTYAENALLLQSDMKSSGKYAIVKTVAHELAHQVEKVFNKL